MSPCIEGFVKKEAVSKGFIGDQRSSFFDAFLVLLTLVGVHGDGHDRHRDIAYDHQCHGHRRDDRHDADDRLQHSRLHQDVRDRRDNYHDHDRDDHQPYGRLPRLRLPGVVHLRFIHLNLTSTALLRHVGYQRISQVTKGHRLYNNLARTRERCHEESLATEQRGLQTPDRRDVV